MFYLCSLGSNVDPERHVEQVILELVTRFDRVTLSPFIYTAAVGMVTQRRFINALFWFNSSQPEAQVKTWFNALEQAHGRDRCDALRSVKDRTLDLDILALTPSLNFPPPTESYLQPLVATLLSGGGLPSAIEPAPLLVGGLKLGHRTTTIHLDPATRHIAIVD